MRFISIRDLRNKSAFIKKALPFEKEMILTSNGKPIACISAVTEADLENFLMTVRKVRAIAAVNEIQEKSKEKGLDKLTAGDIEKEINAVRKARK